MKFMILPAKNLQCGDVVIDTSKNLCGRVLGQNVTESTRKGVVEYRVNVTEGERTGHTTVSFTSQAPVGVVREDDVTEVDVAALLSELGL